ncbi:L-histidine N(alpha)-methyltransferase [Legionella clemsonensis]|uniref:Histidine-specific methyltransferase EgtD n=1 Tax=Legionella clemsonensis TaxID=1867846 RepID=A0A222P1U7_9GAMM|nr:L-histidine N(alpha)-methyltransferase [Legionella clemsonensis]ASQ45834.1 Histidine-specific methyltransferase EgtD [Legionella clemsonensis]
MSAKIQTLQKYPNNSLDNKEFMQDVLVGLSRKNKQLSSKYFYDAVGSSLFNQITHHPDYYLTGCELEILKHHKKELSDLLKDEEFNLVEFGPGEGLKTNILINQFLKDHLSFTYYAVDISKKYLDNLVNQFKQKLPQLNVVALNSDYIAGIEWLSLNSSKRNFLLFLGSSIGNFDIPAAKKFLQNVRNSLHEGDYFLIGFDLRKEINILLRAYNDSDGLTREFNLNLLRRINNELQSNFDLDSFYHYGIYNPHTGAMESYLISLEDQIVHISALKKSFTFKKFEPIRVESSYKYSAPQIKKLAKESGFEIIKNYSDSKKYFINSLWQAH